MITELFKTFLEKEKRKDDQNDIYKTTFLNYLKQFDKDYFDIAGVY